MRNYISAPPGKGSNFIILKPNPLPMKNSKALPYFTIIALFAVCLTLFNCKKKDDAPNRNSATFEPTAIDAFFAKYPKLSEYQEQVSDLYEDEQYHYIWYDRRGKIETAEVLHDEINNIGEEGIPTAVPYKAVFDDLFEKDGRKPDNTTELFLTTYFFYYTTKVNRGIPEAKSKQLGWYLPRKKLSYAAYLDTLLVDPKEIVESNNLIPQYYELKKALKQYRQIDQKGGWKTITTPEGFKSFKPGDNDAAIAQIRTRLAASGDLGSDSKSTTYDESLKEALLKYKARSGYEADATILPKHIKDMNVSVGQRIKAIVVNMERCRWISPQLAKSGERIVINVPAYRLTYYRDNKIALSSNVVVGTALNKTVIFSGMMRHLVFSPYWNVPTSILKKEIQPGIAKDPNYLAKHNMEWHQGNVRQKPGPENSLGLVKFLFPNSNNIYLHDSPAKGLYEKEDRAFSHGCIRVEKARELANIIMKNDAGWDEAKVADAMKKGEEKWYNLKTKIPVYIGYFTAWVDTDGQVHFYDDIYNRDNNLAKVLMEE